MILEFRPDELQKCCLYFPLSNAIAGYSLTVAMILWYVLVIQLAKYFTQQQQKPSLNYDPSFAAVAVLHSSVGKESRFSTVGYYSVIDYYTANSVWVHFSLFFYPGMTCRLPAGQLQQISCWEKIGACHQRCFVSGLNLQLEAHSDHIGLPLRWTFTAFLIMQLKKKKSDKSKKEKEFQCGSICGWTWTQLQKSSRCCCGEFSTYWEKALRIVLFFSKGQACICVSPKLTTWPIKGTQVMKGLWRNGNN